tara:strand:+ start:524 stop:1135 length:612 start_codon:yes stop_codon:yes gene_type:complete
MDDMKIYFDGSSWMTGVELEDKSKRYSTLISKHLGAEEYNIANGGASNNRILRQLVIENDIANYDLAIIQMSMAMRWEYYDDYKKEWIQLRPINAPSERESKKWLRYYYAHMYSDHFGNVYEHMYSQLVRDHCKVKGTPLILLTNRHADGYKYSNLPTDFKFDLDISDSKYSRAPKGHPSEEGHLQITQDILKVYDLMSSQQY